MNVRKIRINKILFVNICEFSVVFVKIQNYEIQVEKNTTK